MIDKHPLYPVRTIPGQFSWVDQRLVRDRHIDHLSHPAAALYLFLVTVSDAQGLSYYSDPSIMKRLSMGESVLDEARRNLTHLRLIAYRKPLYQVLSLDSPPEPAARVPMDKPLPLAQIFKRMLSHD